ncbi:MAG TPA: hypothetical protein PLU87_02895 [Sedimentisphaerales bacterium]|nr:hypothetical protein [Sedimentisphaerales bacterium]HRS09970.1 hypothetical protein [Sedimentisphaerales bacterium]HRV46676.1 hypothetical protein [Sedimentisphaerales bacterium]
MDVLVRIKRLVVYRRVLFTEKAEIEMVRDSLTPELVYEAILNAPAIFKVLRSRNPKAGTSERLYVIKGLTFDGMDVYTKGKILKREGVEVFYVLISSKRSTDI